MNIYLNQLKYIFQVDLAKLLARTIAKMLSPKKAVFYGCMQGNRVGIEEFVETLRQLGLTVIESAPDDKYIEGIALRNIWVWIVCRY